MKFLGFFVGSDRMLTKKALENVIPTELSVLINIHSIFEKVQWSSLLTLFPLEQCWIRTLIFSKTEAIP